jgi:hypothetical protein
MSEILPGFNSDIIFQGKTYHVQTEDWGEEKSFVVTRVYVSGSVVQSIKTPYESLEENSTASGRRAIQMGMREQHQKVLDQLVSGSLTDTSIK